MHSLLLWGDGVWSCAVGGAGEYRCALTPAWAQLSLSLSLCICFRIDLIFSETVSIVLPANVIFTVGFDRYPLSD